jgi:hypothetical protein
MDLNNKEYLAHTFKSVAGGFLFLFLAGFILSSGPDAFQWLALAGAIVFWIAGSFVKASCDLEAKMIANETIRE